MKWGKEGEEEEEEEEREGEEAAAAVQCSFQENCRGSNAELRKERVLVRSS